MKNATPDLPKPVIGPTRQVIPGPGLPRDLRLWRANNNLDVVRHDGRIYLAFRTAPSHFASPLARIEVISSDDCKAWQAETTVATGRDVREPRLLSWNGHLFLYFFRAGRNPLSFKPERIHACEQRRPGRWSEPEPVSEDGCAVWRTKVLGGTPYMTMYAGGENIYKTGAGPVEVRLVTTDDGYNWHPVDPDRQAVHVGGASEADFAFDDSGELWAVIRNEGGDRDGWGSKVCRAPAGQPARWECRPDPRKFDSPLVFKHAGEVYLVARRNLAFDGRYDLGLRGLPHPAQTLVYEAAYWFTRKRTSLWRVDRENWSVEWLADLPSKGDTAFAALLAEDDGSYQVFNYSSPIDGGDRPWLAGQLGQTRIYATRLAFE